MSEFDKSRLRLRLIPNDTARAWLDKWHPLGAGCPFSFAFAVTYSGEWCGVISFGAPIANGAVRSAGLEQWQSLELRKMMCLESLPKNGESCALGIAARLVFKQYPHIRLLLTYCDEEERATAYKAAGWEAGKAYRYLREVLVAGVWYSIRDALRKRIDKQATDRKFVARRKWLLWRKGQT